MNTELKRKKFQKNGKFPVKLRNMYNGEVVICDDMNTIINDNFIKVYYPDKPERNFLVNKEFFTKV